MVVAATGFGFGSSASVTQVPKLWAAPEWLNSYDHQMRSNHAKVTAAIVAEFVRLRLLPVDMNNPTLLFTPASLSSLMRSSSIGCCEQYSSMSLRYVSMRRRKLRRSSATASDTIRSLNRLGGEGEMGVRRIRRSRGEEEEKRRSQRQEHNWPGRLCTGPCDGTLPLQRPTRYASWTKAHGQRKV